MAGERTLLSYTPEIKVVDCTIRDGGLTNDFFFTDQFVKDLYIANVKAGVDYMEFGYKASKDKENALKKAKGFVFGYFTDCKKIFRNLRIYLSLILRNRGYNAELKISVMADVGRCDYEKDIIDKKDSPIDMIRVATYINTIPAAVAMIEYCHEKGYETSCNIMAISKSNDIDIDAALEQLCQSSVDVIYLVDSYGSLYPEQIRRLSEKYVSFAEAHGKKVGIHAHNNQQLAFANTTEAVIKGVSYLDATVSSLGRGAGNCPSELLLGFLKNPKYKIHPILDFIQQEIVPLRESGVKWGYDVPYLLTGILNQHPRSAIAFENEERTDYKDFYIELLENF